MIPVPSPALAPRGPDDMPTPSSFTDRLQLAPSER
jgi:hypothetical protein